MSIGRSKSEEFVDTGLKGRSLLTVSSFSTTQPLITHTEHPGCWRASSADVHPTDLVSIVPTTVPPRPRESLQQPCELLDTINSWFLWNLDKNGSYTTSTASTPRLSFQHSRGLLLETSALSLLLPAHNLFESTCSPPPSPSTLSSPLPVSVSPLVLLPSRRDPSSSSLDTASVVGAQAPRYSHGQTLARRATAPGLGLLQGVPPACISACTPVGSALTVSDESLIAFNRADDMSETGLHERPRHRQRDHQPDRLCVHACCRRGSQRLHHLRSRQQRIGSCHWTRLGPGNHRQ